MRGENVNGRVIQNNFDLIRLFAALQVALMHSAQYLNVDIGLLGYFSYLPGVPIFFFISGYLIYQSYSNAYIKYQSRTSVLRSFFFNRFLRLYPALFVCCSLTLLSILLSGYWDNVSGQLLSFWVWIISVLTFFPFYTPGFMEDWGTGSFNGSLWTIAVEVQFYIITPLLFWFYRAAENKAILLYVVLLSFVAINTINGNYNALITFREKLLNLTFFPWLYMFFIGALVSKYRQLQVYILKQKLIVLILLYIIIYHFSVIWDLGVSNRINPVAYLFLCFVIFKLAFTLSWLSDLLLRRQDISYGVYIYHMPIVNILVYLGLQEDYFYLIVALFSSIFMGIISWVVVEKPALKFKKIALRRAA